MQFICDKWLEFVSEAFVMSGFELQCGCSNVFTLMVGMNYVLWFVCMLTWNWKCFVYLPSLPSKPHWLLSLIIYKSTDEISSINYVSAVFFLLDMLFKYFIPRK